MGYASSCIIHSPKAQSCGMQAACHCVLAQSWGDLCAAAVLLPPSSGDIALHLSLWLKGVAILLL